MEDLEEDTDKFQDIKIFKQPKAMEFCNKFRLDPKIFDIEPESSFAEVLSKLMKKLAKIKKKKRKKQPHSRNSLNSPLRRHATIKKSPFRKSKFEKLEDGGSGKYLQKR